MSVSRDTDVLSSRTIAPSPIPPLALILSLSLNQTLNLTGDNFPRGQLSEHQLSHNWQQNHYVSFLDLLKINKIYNWESQKHITWTYLFIY